MTERPGPKCVECGRVSALVYSKSIPELARYEQRPVWLCACGARVGCHPGRLKPLGRPAGPELRRERMLLHRRLDPLWSGAYPDAEPKARAGLTRLARKRLYSFLQERMGLTEEECHVGHMVRAQVAQANRILDGLSYADVRAWAHARKQAAQERREAERAGRLGL